mmetsp:Transcript_11051/g.20821  ORF Transcript_11051/g.20821 Transcript_11051/m.20821 type:complete len:472 (-) Transcript_11051:230-1645(-)
MHLQLPLLVDLLHGKAAPVILPGGEEADDDADVVPGAPRVGLHCQPLPDHPGLLDRVPDQAPHLLVREHVPKAVARQDQEIQILPQIVAHHLGGAGDAQVLHVQVPDRPGDLQACVSDPPRVELEGQRPPLDPPELVLVAGGVVRAQLDGLAVVASHDAPAVARVGHEDFPAAQKGDARGGSRVAALLRMPLREALVQPPETLLQRLPGGGAALRRHALRQHALQVSRAELGRLAPPVAVKDPKQVRVNLHHPVLLGFPPTDRLERAGGAGNERRPLLLLCDVLLDRLLQATRGGGRSLLHDLVRCCDRRSLLPRRRRRRRPRGLQSVRSSPELLQLGVNLVDRRAERGIELPAALQQPVRPRDQIARSSSVVVSLGHHEGGPEPLRGHRGLELLVAVPHLQHGVAPRPLFRAVAEGEHARQHLVQENAERVHVRLSRVRLLGENLGRHVLQRANQKLLVKSAARLLSRPP